MSTPATPPTPEEEEAVQKSTDPTRGATFPAVSSLFGRIKNAISPPDTSWHDSMVRAANQSFAKPADSGVGKPATNQNEQQNSAGKRMMKKPAKQK